MSLHISSQNLIQSEENDPNAEKTQLNTEKTSLISSRQTTERESSLGKGRTLTRKPDTRNNNLQSYKQNKRKSLQKIQSLPNQNKMEQPPLYPRSSLHSVTNNQSDIDSGSNRTPINSISQRSGQTVKFKKKAMSKQQVIEIQDYVKTIEGDLVEVVSLAGSEKPVQEPNQSSKIKQLNKKSKTQYFYIQDFQGINMEMYASDTLSENQKLQMISLKEKCKSLDQSGSMLQKRIKWLNEEVEMHLERETTFENQKKLLKNTIKQKNKKLQEQAALYKLQKQKLTKQIRQKQLQNKSLKQLLQELSNKFQDDKEILISQMQYLKVQKQQEMQDVLTSGQQKIILLTSKISQLLQENKELQFRLLHTTEHSNTQIIDKLVNQNKYLKIQNHMLTRYKDDLVELKRQNKRISNERDNLKKRIIESAKREAKRYRQEEDSQDASQFFTLSQISSLTSQEHPAPQ